MLSRVRDIIQADGVSALASRSIAYAYRQISFAIAYVYQQRVRRSSPHESLSAARASRFVMMSSGATASFQNRGSLFLREMILTTRLRSWRV